MRLYTAVYVEEIEEIHANNLAYVIIRQHAPLYSRWLAADACP